MWDVGGYAHLGCWRLCPCGMLEVMPLWVVGGYARMGAPPVGALVDTTIPICPHLPVPVLCHASVPDLHSWALGRTDPSLESHL